MPSRKRHERKTFCEQRIASGVELSTEEMRQEQQFIDRPLRAARPAAGRGREPVRDALAQVGTGLQARLERDVLVAEHSGLLAALNAGENGLCFGRIDLRDGATTTSAASESGRTTPSAPRCSSTGGPTSRARSISPPGTPRWGCAAAGTSPPRGARSPRCTTRSSTSATPTRTGYEDADADAVLLAALNAARTGRMDDIVQTIQAEQDRIIRAPHRGVLVVEGGPGTGKTAVALHRAAYLLYAHRELLAKRAVLIVGPNPAFLGYIGEVLPVARRDRRAARDASASCSPACTPPARDSPGGRRGQGPRRRWPTSLAAGRTRPAGAARPGRSPIDRTTTGILMLDRDMASRRGARRRETGLPHNLARPHFAFRDHRRAHRRSSPTGIGADPYGGPNLLGPDDIAQLGKEHRRRAPRCTRPSTSCGRGSPRSSSSPTSSPTPAHLPDEDAGARSARPATPGVDRRPTCRCSTRPPSSSARTTASARAAAEAERAGADRLRAGRAGRLVRLPHRTSSRTRTTRTPRSWPRTTSSTPSGWPSGTRRPTTAAPPSAPPPTGPGPSGTSSSTRRRSCRRWRGGC